MKAGIMSRPIGDLSDTGRVLVGLDLRSANMMNVGSEEAEL